EKNVRIGWTITVTPSCTISNGQDRIVAAGLFASAPDAVAHGGFGEAAVGEAATAAGFHGGGRFGDFHGRRRFFGPGFGFYGYGYPWWDWDYPYYYPYPYYGYDAYYGNRYYGNCYYGN